MTSLLLDTHAAIWLTNSQPLSKAATEIIKAVRASGETIHVSPISAWEIGLLAARGRVNLNARPEVWFDRLMQGPSLALTPLLPDVLIAASFLPVSSEMKDPADRILVATAREYGYQLVTRDRKLLDYASEGHLQAIAC